MKTGIRTIMAFVLAIILLPLPTFAASTPPYEVLNPRAKCVIADNNGNTISPEFDYYKNSFKDFPKDGTTIKVFYDGVIDSSADETFVSQGGTFKSGKQTLVYSVSDRNYEKNTVELLLYRKANPHAYDSKYVFYLCTDLRVTSIHAPLKRISYNPANIRVYSESIKQTANDGSTYYDFRRRAQHKAPDGSTWKSPFAEGDKITAYFADGTSTVYENKNVKLDVGYVDYFVSQDGEQTWAYTENDKLSKGANTVVVYLWKQPVKITTSIEVFLWTIDMGTYPGDYADEQPLADGKTASEKQTEKQKAPVVTAGEKTVKPVSVIKIKNVNTGRIGKKLNITWKALSKTERSKVSKIQVQYSTTKQFRRAKTIWVKKSLKKYTSKKLKKGKYYVRMRSMRKIKDKKYYSKWSTVKSVTIR